MTRMRIRAQVRPLKLEIRTHGSRDDVVHVLAPASASAGAPWFIAQHVRPQVPPRLGRVEREVVRSGLVVYLSAASAVALSTGHEMATRAEPGGAH